MRDYSFGPINRKVFRKDNVLELVLLFEYSFIDLFYSKYNYIFKTIIMKQFRNTL